MCVLRYVCASLDEALSVWLSMQATLRGFIYPMSYANRQISQRFINFFPQWFSCYIFVRSSLSIIDVLAPDRYTNETWVFYLIHCKSQNVAEKLFDGYRNHVKLNWFVCVWHINGRMCCPNYSNYMLRLPLIHDFDHMVQPFRSVCPILIAFSKYLLSAMKQVWQRFRSSQ